MLTPYDEYPIHQAPYPVSHVPATDYNWDNGYYWGVFDPVAGVVLAMGMRINPNTDMIGGYAMLNDRGRQLTLRFSRCWRRDFSLKVGPFSYHVLEPLKRLRLQLEPNDSGLSFDVNWEGTCPGIWSSITSPKCAVDVSPIKRATRRPALPKASSNTARRSTSSHATRGPVHVITRGVCIRERPPLGPVQSLLPPRPQDGPERAMHLWVPFQAGAISGFLEHNEYPDGTPCESGDVASGAFNGEVNWGWSGKRITLGRLQHKFRYRPGTRVLSGATLDVVDTQGGRWLFEFDIPSLPFVPHTFGYFPGSWKDGGTFHTYHGSEELAVEWDEIDASVQPLKYKPYNVKGDAARDGFGFGFTQEQPISGVEHIASLTVTAPDGSVHKGGAQVEHWVRGRYEPYGFE